MPKQKVDRQHARGAAMLGEVGVEAVERADVQHALSYEGHRQEGHSIAVIARDAGGVEAVLGIERESVKPQRHPPENPPRGHGVGPNRQQVGDGALGVGDLGGLRRVDQQATGRSLTGCRRIVNE
jgi:hypothetical protein